MKKAKLTKLVFGFLSISFLLQINGKNLAVERQQFFTQNIVNNIVCRNQKKSPTSSSRRSLFSWLSKVPEFLMASLGIGSINSHVVINTPEELDYVTTEYPKKKIKFVNFNLDPNSKISFVSNQVNITAPVVTNFVSSQGEKFSINNTGNELKFLFPQQENYYHNLLLTNSNNFERVLVTGNKCILKKNFDNITISSIDQKNIIFKDSETTQDFINLLNIAQELVPLLNISFPSKAQSIMDFYYGENTFNDHKYSIITPSFRTLISPEDFIMKDAIDNVMLESGMTETFVFDEWNTHGQIRFSWQQGKQICIINDFENINCNRIYVSDLSYYGKSFAIVATIYGIILFLINFTALRKQSNKRFLKQKKIQDLCKNLDLTIKGRFLTNQNRYVLGVYKKDQLLLNDILFLDKTESLKKDKLKLLGFSLTIFSTIYLSIDIFLLWKLMFTSSMHLYLSFAFTVTSECMNALSIFMFFWKRQYSDRFYLIYSLTIFCFKLLLLIISTLISNRVIGTRTIHHR